MATQTPCNSSDATLNKPSLSKPKRIKIWLNDEPDCFKLLIDPRSLKNWKYVLNYVSEETKSRFGPVKKLVSLKTKATVTNFEELHTSGKYVALGYNQKFRGDKSLYKTPSEKEMAAAKPVRKHYVGEFDSKILPFLKITKKHNLTLVYMAINGSLDGPFKVVFKAADLKNWNLVKNYVTKVLGMADGVHQICTVFGEPLHDAKELQHGCLYVAVPFFERFKAMDYMYLLNSMNKSKLESSHPLEMAIKKQKKSPVSSERDAKSSSQEDEWDSDVDTHEGTQRSLLVGSSDEMDYLENITMNPNPSLLDEYSDTPTQETKRTTSGSCSSECSEDQPIWPSSRPTTLACKKSLPSGCIYLKPKRKPELPLLNKQIRRLTRTVKRYERQLMRLQMKASEKQHERSEEEEEEVEGGAGPDSDIFEHHKYRKFSKFRSKKFL